MFGILAIAAALQFQGNFSQGGLIKITATSGTTIEANNTEVHGGNGTYYIGFERDAPPQTYIEATLPDDTVEAYTLDITQKYYEQQIINNVPQNLVTPDSVTESQITRDKLQMEYYRQTMQDENCPPNIRFTPPSTGRLTAYFGSGRVYNGKQGAPHSGIDFAGAVGTPILAPEAGKVISTDYLKLGGNTLFLDHGCGLVSNFMHLSGFNKSVGDYVERGEVIGFVGQTGLATGPHLHWGVSLGTIRLDPLPLISY
jgi:murein DD-endopeptidase MepM/ murein hydrolase activator NlpD